MCVERNGIKQDFTRSFCRQFIFSRVIPSQLNKLSKFLLQQQQLTVKKKKKGYIRSPSFAIATPYRKRRSKRVTYYIRSPSFAIATPYRKRRSKRVTIRSPSFAVATAYRKEEAKGLDKLDKVPFFFTPYNFFHTFTLPFKN